MHFGGRDGSKALFDLGIILHEEAFSDVKIDIANYEWFTKKYSSDLER